MMTLYDEYVRKRIYLDSSLQRAVLGESQKLQDFNQESVEKMNPTLDQKSSRSFRALSK